MSKDHAPLVSAHIITYNQEPYIAQTIEGALRQQTDFEVEILVGEDCSTDGTRRIVLDYQRQYPQRIRMITSDRNVGAFANSQRVLQACRGRYLALCDGDDHWTSPHKLQTQVEFLEAHPEYSLCCHDVEVVCDGVAKMNRFAEFTRDTFAFDDAVMSHFISTSSVVCRREPMMAIPPWFQDYRAIDVFVELLLLDQGLGRYLHETMGVKVDNPGGISLIPEERAARTGSLLHMYQRLDQHTEGRHRGILRWKMARLCLTLAGASLRTRRMAPFFKFAWDSLRQDPTALGEAVRRRWRRPSAVPQ